MCANRATMISEKERGGHFRDPLALSCSVGPAGGYGQGFPAQTESLLIARQQRNEDADRQIETGIRLDADMAELVQRVASLRVIEND